VAAAPFNRRVGARIPGVERGDISLAIGDQPVETPSSRSTA
jgi:uncharacterized membrane protein